jgi:predicted DNA repair protein MutK
MRFLCLRFRASEYQKSKGAVNAEKSSGFLTNRELPALWKITKGSLLNKLIILPIAFLLSAFVPLAITVILLLGGIYLAYEGAEKIYHFLFHRKEVRPAKKIVEQTKEEVVSLENERIKSAVFVDFILSIEIVIIALSTVTDSALNVQIPVVTFIAVFATIGVYGLVALIVRMDDMGYKLIKRNKNKFTKNLGVGLVKGLPIVIKTLNVVGTVALVLVAGGIFTHNIHYVHELLGALPSLAADTVVGLIVGFIALGCVGLFQKVKGVPIKI